MTDDLVNAMSEVFPDDTFDTIMSKISTSTKEYYEKNDSKYHPTCIFLYGFNNFVLDTKVINLTGAEDTKEYFESLGYQTASQLAPEFATFLICFSTEAWIYTKESEEAKEEESEGAILVGLMVDGRRRIVFQKINRDEDGNIRVLDGTIVNGGDVSLLLSMYDGMRQFYLENKVLDEV